MPNYQTVNALFAAQEGLATRSQLLALGVPATIRPDASNLTMIRLSADEYVANGHRYRESLERID